MTKLVFLCVVVTALLLQAGSLCLAGSPSFTCTAAESGGAWSEEATWVDCPSGVPDVNDTVLISGPTTVVTIASGESVTVVHLEVNNAATLASRGSLNAVYVEVDEAKLTSTGKITLMDSDEDTYGYNTGFDAYRSDVRISSDLTISGREAYIYVESSDVTIGGTVNVTCSDGDTADVAFYESRLSVAGDFVINGGLVNNDFKREEKPKRSTEKRGWFGGIDGSYLESYFSSIEIKGDLSITSRDHTGNTTDEYTSTGSVNLAVFGGQIVVGGDVLIKSGDALVAETGNAIVAGPFPSVALISAPSYIMSEAPSALLVVGGSVTVESGSVTGLRNDSDSGNQAGTAMFDLLKIDAYINGSMSSLTVQSGSAGSSTADYGGSANEAFLSLGGGSRLVVTNDVVVQSGNGGNAEHYGDHGGAASAIVIFGGEMLVGGEMRVVGGNGGNASSDDSDSGEGGAGALGMINGGSINVAGDLLVSSGSSGISTRGAAAYEATVIMSTSSFAETTSVPMPLAARLASLDTRGIPSESGRYSATGASNLRVGGDLNIIGGSAGSSSYSGYSGASCEAQFASPTISENIGGLILENVWDGEVIVGGDINIRGCDGGDSSDSSGGDTVPIGIMASGGVSLAVYGSVNVQAGSGGSAMSSSRGGNGNTAFVIALVSSDINVAGSLTTVAGNGGDVTNSTGEPGSVNSGINGLFVYSNSHVNVQGAVTVNGGRGGNVNTDGSNGYSGGSAADVTVTVYDRASLVAGSVRVELGTTGNATSSDSSGVEKRNKESSTGNNEGSQRRSKLSQLAEKLNLEIKVDKRGSPFSETSGVWVGYSSSITTNGDVAIVGGPTSFSTYAEPASGKSASFGLSTFSTATIRGDVSVIAESGGSTLTETSLDTGSTAEIYVGDESVFKARGNVLLQGGDASTGPNSTTGVQGVAYFELTDGAQFYQSGLFVLRDGKGDNQTDPDTSTGIYLVRSEWTVYPCDGAGVEMTQRNSTYFQMNNFATFKDCRGSGARQRYPEPTSDGSADASCSPCTCQEEALSSCPDQSSAAHLHANSVVAWLLAAVLQW